MADDGSDTKLRFRDVVIVVGVGVLAVVVAFWLLHFIAGIFWGILKLAIVVLVVAGVLWLVLGRRSKR